MGKQPKLSPKELMVLKRQTVISNLEDSMLDEKRKQFKQAMKKFEVIDFTDVLVNIFVLAVVLSLLYGTGWVMYFLFIK